MTENPNSNERYRLLLRKAEEGNLTSLEQDEFLQLIRFTEPIENTEVETDVRPIRYLSSDKFITKVDLSIEEVERMVDKILADNNE